MLGWWCVVFAHFGLIWKSWLICLVCLLVFVDFWLLIGGGLGVLLLLAFLVGVGYFHCFGICLLTELGWFISFDYCIGF